MKNKKMRINLSMNNKYQDKLKLLAEAEDTPASRLVRRWIDEHFEENYKKIEEIRKKRKENE